MLEEDFYRTYSKYLRDIYGEKVYKLPVKLNLSCPNRDGNIATGGCIFCGEGGSGDFTIYYEGKRLSREELIYNHQEIPKGDYIAYFQSFTNTYAPTSKLREIFTAALEDDLFAGISIATRPDCLQKDVIELLKELKEKYINKFIWVELGLQTIHESTAKWMNRGYPLEVFDEAVKNLKAIDIEVIVHIIIGLPGENQTMLLETIEHLNACQIDGVKLQLLHYLKNTRLGIQYLSNPSQYHVLEMDEYVELVTECVAHLDEHIVIHRLTGDGNAEDLIAPLWSTDKRRVLNLINHMLKIKNYTQGCKLSKPGGIYTNFVIEKNS